ncbi:MAG: hypothetical protein JSR55_03110 [Proteobacteria bacterium]|nr:hypothetical protein [Pseudomonadota bacterium]
MRRAFALVLFAIVLAAPACADEDAIRSIAYARWVDIGPGRTVAQLKPAEIAELRRCKDWTMHFQPFGDGITQTFIAGMTMSNSYSRVQVSRLAGETIFILSQKGGSKTRDTLHLSKDGNVLMQISPPFRPHVFLRCAEPQKK